MQILSGYGDSVISPPSFRRSIINGDFGVFVGLFLFLFQLSLPSPRRGFLGTGLKSPSRGTMTKSSS